MSAKCEIPTCGHALSMHNELGYCRSGTTPDRSGVCICDSTQPRAGASLPEPPTLADDGCDCTELCSMGPTCPGAIAAYLPGAGCWRADDDADFHPWRGATDEVDWQKSMARPVLSSGELGPDLRGQHRADDACPFGAGDHRPLIEQAKAEALEEVIDAIEETFLAHLPSKALSYCAQEDVNTGLAALRERFLVGR